MAERVTPRATADFETRSACPIRTSGSWRYSLDPTTEVLCMAFRLPHWDEGRTALWHPVMPHLGITDEGDTDDLLEFFDWVDAGGLVEAHNAFFERGIWRNICEPKLFWPTIPHKQWRCSAAKCAAHALPRGLGDAADALDLTIRKDEEGAVTMKKMAKPRNPTKADIQAWGRQHAPCPVCRAAGRVGSLKKDGTPTIKGKRCETCGGSGFDPYRTVPPMPILWHESRELMERLWAYCRVDVLAEEGISHALPDLSPYETQIWLLDQAVNERGFTIDTDAVALALDLVEGEYADLNAELSILTGGAVERATQRARLLAWLETRGCALDDTTADTVSTSLDRTDLADDVRRALEILRALGKSSTAKYEAMAAWVCPDSRVHGGLLYHGASTGRWTGAGVQPHNFPKG